mgnify:CR=1 FL=1
MRKNTNIAPKKAKASIQIALAIAGIAILNGTIDLLKEIPEERIITIYNSPIHIERAQARENEAPQGETPQNRPETTPEPTEALTAEFSAYTASEDETDSDPYTTASGKRVHQGTLACPDRIIIQDGKRTFGTKIEIEGLGTFVCEDRMGPRYRDQENFDIYHETKAEAFAFGRRTLAYRIID